MIFGNDINIPYFYRKNLIYTYPTWLASRNAFEHSKLALQIDADNEKVF
jgi:hypothetical protein